MKNLIKVFMPMILLLTSLNTFVQAENVNVSARTLESLEILRELDFVNDDYNQETIDFKATVTRAEFANVSAKIFNVSGTQGDSLYFYDVSRDYYAYDAVTYLTNVGAINVNEEKLFHPETEITVTEASKIVLYALGYSTIVEGKGGFPNGVNAVAMNIDLLDGVSSTNGKLTFDGMFNLLYNAVMTEVFDVAGFSDGNMTLESNGTTFLNEKYGIYFEKGIFSGFNGTYFGDTECYENQAAISGTLFETDGREYFEYLGCEVKYLYKHNKRSDEYKLMWVKSTGKTDVIELDSVENSTKFDGKSYGFTYWDSKDKEHNINLPKSISVIYNGRLLTSGIEEVLDGGFDSIRLVDVNSVREYSLAIVSSYKSFVVGSVDKVQQKIYDKNSNYVIDLGNTDEVFVYNASGLPTDISSITKNCVVSVYSSKDSDITKIYISNTVFEGKISSSSNDGYGVTYTIDGNAYRLDKNYKAEKQAVGKPIKVFVDVNGKIVYIEKIAGSKKFGYLIRAVKTEDLNASVIVKVFTEDGKLKEYICSEKAKIDDVSYKKNYPDSIFNALGGELIVPQLIMYSVNDNDEIVMIDTVAGDAVSDFHKAYEKASRTYKGGKLIAETAGGSLMIDSSTTIFRIPDNPQTAEEYQFGIIKPTSFYDWKLITCEGYSVNSESFITDALVWYGNGTSSEHGYMLVDQVVSTLNDDEEIVTEITGYYGSKELIVQTDSGYVPTDLKRGDVVLLTKDAKDTVIDVNLVYRSGEKSPEFKYDHHNEYRLIWGYVYDAENNIVKIAKSDDATKADDIFKVDTVWIYYSDEDYIEKGSVNDLVGTKYSENVEIIIYSQQGYVNTAYAIR